MYRLRKARITLLMLSLSFFILYADSSYGTEKIVWRIGFTSTGESSALKETRMFKRILEEKFPGRLDIQIFPRSQLGKGTEMLMNVKMGNLDMGLFISEIPTLDMRLGFFDLPWLFDNVAHFRAIAEGPVGKDMLSLIEKKGIKPIGIYWNGFRQVGTVKKPVRKHEDMKGLKIRMAPNPRRTLTFSSMGAAPVKLPSGETYVAMQMGVVDGAEATTFVWSQKKWDEVIKYFTLLNYSCAPNFAMISRKFWNSLPTDIQKSIEEASNAVAKWSYENAEKWDQKAVDDIDKRVKVIRLTPESLSAFKNAVDPVKKDFRQKYGTKWFEEVEKAR